jgi:hypothetical protein
MVKSMRLMVLALGAAALGACSDSSVTSVPKQIAAGTGPEFLTAAQLVGVPGPGTQASPIVYPLYAGGGGGGTGTLVGNVSVWSVLVSGNTYAIHVTYNITLAGACLTGTHLDIELQPTAVPQNNGNPTPGKFAYKHDDNCTTTDSYTVNFNLGATDNGVVIAAHAGVLGVGAPIFAGANFVSGGVGASMTGNVVNRRPGNQSGFTAVNTPLVLAWEPNNNVDPSYWDQVINADPSGNGAWLLNNGADWVWETFRVQDPIQGTVIQANVTINVPVATTGTFRITCDNGYRVDLNGTTITTADGVTAGLGTQLSNDFAANIATNTNLKQANVSGDGWQTVGSYSVNLLAGANNFVLYGVNEYMNTDDSHTGFAGFGGIGVRAAGTDPVGDINLNPAGCIFGLAANPVAAGEETAWGAPIGFNGATEGATNVGGNFTGSNWATWFAYKVR